MVTEWLKETDNYVIYGAQVVAVGAYTAITHLTGKKPQCFAVASMDGNPEEIDGIPVRLIETIPKSTYIVVGVTELIQQEVLPYLDTKGYRNLFPLSQHEEHRLMADYYKRIGKFPLA